MLISLSLSLGVSACPPGTPRLSLSTTKGATGASSRVRATSETAQQADKQLADLMKRFKRIQRLPHKVGNERRRVRSTYGYARHRRLATCMEKYFPEPKPKPPR